MSIWTVLQALYAERCSMAVVHLATSSCTTFAASSLHLAQKGSAEREKKKKPGMHTSSRLWTIARINYTNEANDKVHPLCCVLLRTPFHSRTYILTRYCSASQCYASTCVCNKCGSLVLGAMSYSHRCAMHWCYGTVEWNHRLELEYV